jgi:hypothetical protein
MSNPFHISPLIFLTGYFLITRWYFAKKNTKVYNLSLGDSMESDVTF